jgi:hypothetical protein
MAVIEEKNGFLSKNKTVIVIIGLAILAAILLIPEEYLKKKFPWMK